MEAILVCLLLNKPHLYGLTQYRFILIQLVTLTYMLQVLRPSSVMSIQKPYTRRFCIFLCMFFVLTSLRTAKVRAKTCSIHARVTTGIKIILCCIRLNKCDLLGQGLLGNNIVNIQQTAVTWNHLHDIRKHRKLTCRCGRCPICSMVVPIFGTAFPGTPWWLALWRTIAAYWRCRNWRNVQYTTAFMNSQTKIKSYQISGVRGSRRRSCILSPFARKHCVKISMDCCV
jgi:hypothetical protein